MGVLTVACAEVSRRNSGEIVKVEDGRFIPMLRVHEFGDPNGPPVLALHGVAAHGRRWGPLAAGELAGFRVLGPDLRGHGESVWDPPWSLPSHVGDLVEVLDALELESVSVVGHSFGGAVGANLAAAVPGRVRALALLDPAIGWMPAAPVQWLGSTASIRGSPPRTTPWPIEPAT